MNAELTRVISQEGCALLQRHNLLTPLVQQMVISEAIADSPVDQGMMEQAKLAVVKEHGHQSLENWSEVVVTGNLSTWCSRRSAAA